MKSSSDLLQVVALECPYESFRGSETQRFLLQSLSLKLESYQNVYPEGVLPLDTYDFVSTHYLVGTPEIGGGFRVLMVFRTTSLERCEKHCLPFPGLAVLRASGAGLHAQVLEESLREWKARMEPVSYGSGWAIAPVLRQDRELRNRLKDIMAAMLVSHDRENGIQHMIVCGAARVHSDEFLQSIGYERMLHASVPLPPFAQSSLINTEAVVLHTTRYNERADQLVAEYRHLWEGRWRVPGRMADVIPLRGAALKKVA